MSFCQIDVWKLSSSPISYQTSLAGASMASGRDSPNLSTVISGLHLIFTLTSVAFLSYKVFYLENELSLIRREVPRQAVLESSNADMDVNSTPVTRVQGIEDQEQRSERNRRAGKRKSETSAAEKLKAVCVQKLLSNLQVCSVPLFFVFWGGERECKSPTQVYYKQPYYRTGY